MTFYKSGVSRATRYLRLKPLVKLLDAKINFAIYGPDAIAFVHRGPPYRFRDQVQHILLPKSSIGIAAQILSKHNGYNIFDKPPFPESCAELRLNMYRPIVSPDIPAGPVVLHHPDGEDYMGIEHLFLHASSAFHFDLDDPTKTFTDPDPPHPSVAAIRYPTEIAFIDSLIDTLYEPPFTPRLFNDLPWHDWLTALVESSVCEYPNEWESEEMDLDFDEDNWCYGMRPWGEGTISGREYVLRMVKDENRYLLDAFVRSYAEALAGEPGMSREDMVRMYFEIRAARMDQDKSRAPTWVAPCYHSPTLVSPGLSPAVPYDDCATSTPLQYIPTPHAPLNLRLAVA